VITRRFAPVLVAFLAAATVSTPALPARADGPTAAELRKARSQFQRGLELEQASNWSEAIQLFREVGAVRMTPQVRFHIAYCEEGLGRLVTALGGYELALAEAEQVGPDFKSEVQTAVTSLRARIPKLLIERGKGAEAALVQLDGVDIGASSVGVEVPLDPGPHSVTAAAPGFLPFSVTAELKEREVTRVTLDFEPEPTLPPGGRPGDPSRVIVAPPPPTADRTVPYIIGGAGIATLAGAGVLFALRQATQAQFNKECPETNIVNGERVCGKSNEGTYKRLKAYNLATPIVAVVGVATIGTAVALILFEKKPKTKAPTGNARFELTPYAPGAFAGISLIERF
jgi:hypothetical protein